VLAEGIYYRVKKSLRGTGHTAAEQSFRFFYALRPVSEEQAELCLLDENNKLKPTGLKELVPWSETEDLKHAAKLQPFFEKLRPLLDKLQAAAPPKPKPSRQKEAQPEKQADDWWDATSPGSGSLGKKW
jgi:hypothetical protein